MPTASLNEIEAAAAPSAGGRASLEDVVAVQPSKQSAPEMRIEAGPRSSGLLEPFRRIGAAIVGETGHDTAIGNAIRGNRKEQLAPFINFEALGLQDLVPGSGEVSEGVRGVLEGGQRFLTGMSTPQNALLLAGTGGVGAIAKQAALESVPRALSATFSVDMIKSAWDRIPEFNKALSGGDLRTAAGILTEIAGSTAVGAMAGRHAAEGTTFAPKPLSNKAFEQKLDAMDRQAAEFRAAEAEGGKAHLSDIESVSRPAEQLELDSKPEGGIRPIDASADEARQIRRDALLRKSRLDRTRVEADESDFAAYTDHADAYYLTPRRGNPGVVYLNDGGKKVIRRAIEMTLGEDPGDVWGFSADAQSVRNLSDQIAKIREEGVLEGTLNESGIERLSKVIDVLGQAQKDGDSISIAYGLDAPLKEVKGTRRHEQLHHSLIQEPNRSAGDALIEANPEAAKKLSEAGYKDDLADEMFVRFASGQWDELGIPESQAVESAADFIRNLEKQNGASGAEVLRRSHALVKEAYASKYGRAEELGKAADGLEDTGAPSEEGGGVAGAEDRSRFRTDKRLPGSADGQVGKPKQEELFRAGETAGKGVVSPSYDQTKGKILEKLEISPEQKAAFSERMTEWESKNPDRRAVTFDEIREEARKLDRKLVLDLKPTKAGETLDPVVRLAARETLNGINEQILRDRQAMKDKGEALGVEEQMKLEGRIEQLERDAKGLIDVLLPTRSQDGRNLAYHRMMAEKSFDVDYWLSRARRAMGLPPGSVPPENVAKPIREILAKGAAAERQAAERVRGKKRAGKAPEPAAETDGAAEEQAERVVQTRLSEVEAAKKDLIKRLEDRLAGKKSSADPVTPEERAAFENDPRILDLRSKIAAKEQAERVAETRADLLQKGLENLAKRLKAAIEGEQTATVDPISPAERAAWNQHPEIIRLREELAAVRADKKGLAAPEKRADVVARKRKEFLDRLRDQAKGERATVDPVTAQERALWEQDPEVLALRAEIAQKRAQRPGPTSEQKVDREVNRQLKDIDDKMTGREPEASPWKLTPEERSMVEADPRVREARIELARHMAKLDKSSWWDTISAFRRAGLLTGFKTHLRNTGGNAAFQVLEETSRVPAVIADAALSLFSGKRTVQGPSPRAIGKATYEAATVGMREARDILRKGATDEQLAQFDVARELNAEHLIGKKLNGAINGVFRLMSAEDRLFKRYAMRRSLEEQMKLAKTDFPTEEMMVQAWADADFATFNNQNLAAGAFSAAKGWLKNQGEAGEAGAFGMEMVVPFARTPANILSRVIEYAGGGVVKGAYKTGESIVKRSLTPEQQRAIAQGVGRGATGLTLVYMGWELAKDGLMTGTQPDEPGARGTDEAAGRLPGSLLLGGKWRQISSFSPMGNLLTIGATLFRESSKDLKNEARRPENVAKVATRTVMEQPLLQGVQDVAEGLMEPGVRAQQAVASMAGSFVPTAAADAALALDDRKRDVSADSTIEAIGKGIANRVPGLRDRLPAKLDVLGRPVKQEKISAIDPTIGSEAKEVRDPVARELVAQQVRIAKLRRKPEESREEHGARVYITGRLMEARVRELVEAPEYRALDREDKQVEIRRAIDGARDEVANLLREDGFKELPVSERVRYLRALVPDR